MSWHKKIWKKNQSGFEYECKSSQECEAPYQTRCMQRPQLNRFDCLHWNTSPTKIIKNKSNTWVKCEIRCKTWVRNGRSQTTNLFEIQSFICIFSPAKKKAWKFNARIQHRWNTPCYHLIIFYVAMRKRRYQCQISTINIHAETTWPLLFFLSGASFTRIMCVDPFSIEP